jgi:hypothetical protein
MSPVPLPTLALVLRLMCAHSLRLVLFLSLIVALPILPVSLPISSPLLPLLVSLLLTSSASSMLSMATSSTSSTKDRDLLPFSPTLRDSTLAMLQALALDRVQWVLALQALMLVLVSSRMLPIRFSRLHRLLLSSLSHSRVLVLKWLLRLPLVAVVLIASILPLMMLVMVVVLLLASIHWARMLVLAATLVVAVILFSLVLVVTFPTLRPTMPMLLMAVRVLVSVVLPFSPTTMALLVATHLALVAHLALAACLPLALSLAVQSLARMPLTMKSMLVASSSKNVLTNIPVTGIT